MKVALSHLRTAILIGASLAVAAVSPLRAQTDTTRTEQELPDIAPQEIEIRGTLDISFPSLERQPLVGFNPPPSTYEIPEDRRPYTEEYKQRAADLPHSSLQRPAPPQASGRFGPVHQGFLKIGAGRYLQRTVYSDLNFGVEPGLSMHATVDYQGREGHIPDEATNFASTRDRFNGQLGLASERSNLRLYGNLDGFYNDYLMYGVSEFDGRTCLPPGCQANLDIPEPTRNGAGASFSAGIETGGITPSRLELSYGASRYETNARFQDSTTTLHVDREDRAVVRTTINRGISDLTLSLDGNAAVGGLGDNSVFDSDYFAYDTGLAGLWESGGRVDLEIGARILGYSASTSNRGGRMAYLSPDAKLTFRASDRLQVYVQNRPFAEMPEMADDFRENPYLAFDQAVQPTIASVDGEAGVRVYRGSMQFAVWAGWQEFPNYQYYRTAHADSGPYGNGFFAIGYDEARIIQAGGRASIQLPEGLQASLDLHLRQARLTDQNIVIPYVAPISSSLSFAYPFAGQKGLLEISGTFHGSRYVDLANAERVGAYVELDTEASYDIIDALGVYVSIDNIGVGDLEKWHQYPRPSFVAEGGLRFFW